MGFQAKRKAELKHRRRQEANPAWTPFQKAEVLPHQHLAQAVVQEVLSDALILKNSRYQVLVRKVTTSLGEMFQLSIRRLDRKPIHDWRDLQRIKNEIVGPEHEGIELYPAEPRLVDSANQYWVHVFADPGQRFPVGFNERLVDGESKLGAVQRPFEGD